MRRDVLRSDAALHEVAEHLINRVPLPQPFQLAPVEGDVVAGPVSRVRARLALLALLLGDADLVFRDLGQRDDLLDINEDTTIEAVGLEAYASDIDAALDEPENRCRQLAAELGRRQDDADVLREGILVGLVPPEEVEQFGPRIGVSLA